MLSPALAPVILDLLVLFTGFLSVADAGAAILPPPLSVTPDQNWDGIDGAWSSFTLRLGTPEQYVRVLLSTASYQTWAVLPQGCQAAPSYDSCAFARGGIYNQSASSTFHDVGIYSLWIAQNLGYAGNAIYGYDRVGLAMNGQGNITLANTTVGGFAVEDFYLGVFGVNPKPTNWSSFNDMAPSYMSLLKEQDYIPSLSFGYSAGAPYRFTGVLASLTLGGYDRSKFIENDVEFVFAADNDRDLVVAVQSITTPSQTPSSPASTELLPAPFYAYVDSTVPQLWLPETTCQSFEQEFGLVFDNATQLYLVNDTLHQSLLDRNANVTFTLAQGLSGGPSVLITLPYAAFDLTAKAPYYGLANDTYYFPLRRAANDTQYTLGRTFLQEAYITVDWEASRFNVSQVSWIDNAEQQLVLIPPLSAQPTDGGADYNGASGSNPGDDRGDLGAGAIAGIVIGAVAVLAFLAAILFWRSRRQRNSKTTPWPEKPGSSSSSTNLHSASTVFPKAELDGSNSVRGYYAPGGKAGFLSPLSDTSTGSRTPVLGSSFPSNPSSPRDAGDDTLSSTQSGTLLSVMSPASASSASEADGRERPIYEMPGDMPVIREKDGKQLSEKEALQRREKMYNGVDLNSSVEKTPPSFAPRRTPLDPRDVVRAEHNQRPDGEWQITRSRPFSFEGTTDEARVE